jgi:large subunit ribosomal protein L25
MTKTLKAEKRELTGKKVKQLRVKGLLPAVIFNSEGGSENVTINTRELERALSGATKATVFELEFNGEKLKAIVKEVQSNPRTADLTHAAFFKIDENALMVFDISLILAGISPAVKNNLGTLFQPLNSIQVRCKLSDLVPSISIDISKLDNVGQTIKVNQISIPSAIKLVHKEDMEATIVTITEIQEEKVEEVVEVVASTEVIAGAEGETVEGAEGVAGAEGEAKKGSKKDAKKDDKKGEK